MSEKEKTLRELKGIHWHEIKERGDYGGAECINCAPTSSGAIRSWGWYCPDSPDHQCYYYTEADENGDRYITTINDEKVIVVSNPDWETDDCCIFCGDPEERK